MRRRRGICETALLQHSKVYGSALTIVTTLVVLTAATAARALAVSEACPAQIQRVSPIGVTASDEAASYVYELDAISPRTVDATIIADTSNGWYMWGVSGVSLAKVVRRMGHTSYDDAASVPLGVMFPSSVLLRHAWVVRAKSSGELVMGWDALGNYECALPAFSANSIAETPGNPVLHPTPAPLPSPVSLEKAAATVAPFAPASCVVPFAMVNVATAVQPYYPMGLNSQVSAFVDVTVDAQGKVIDASMRATSGSKDADELATQAAATSSYKAGVSYCQQVGGHYIFRVDFNP